MSEEKQTPNRDGIGERRDSVQRIPAVDSVQPFYFHYLVSPQPLYSSFIEKSID